MKSESQSLKNKIIIQIVMEKINPSAEYTETIKGDWIYYSNSLDSKDYYLKSATITKKNEFNFSISDIKNGIYCICLSENKIYVFKIDNISSEKKIVLDKNFDLKPPSQSLKKEEICTIVIDNLIYREILQDNNRIESLLTPDRIAGFGSKYKFLLWYKKEQKECCYCGVKEEYLKMYFNKNNKQYFVDDENKARQRGQYLEIERIVTTPKDKNIYSEDNCALACYICNNAKSDFLSAKTFKPIAKGINEFWNNTLKERNQNYKTINFHEDSRIWDMI